MTKKNLKRNITKIKRNVKKTKKHNKKTNTRKVKYGGDESLVDLQKQKTAFRIELNNIINQIINRNNSRNKIKEVITLLNNFFINNKKLINTLIPVSLDGKYVLKGKYANVQSSKEIVDFVSPVIFILNSFWGKDLIKWNDIKRVLNSYFINGGNFSNKSSRFKITPLKNELNKRRVDNVRMLLDKSNDFYIIEDGLDDATKEQIAELIPNEQQIHMEPEEQDPDIQHIVHPEPAFIKLQLPYPLPEDNNIGYNRSNIPEFWKPIFGNGEELQNLRQLFMEMYKIDRYTRDEQKIYKICNIIERIIPSYWTRASLDFREMPKTLVNVNIVNCFITLFYGIILNKLYESKQDYLFIFKGGRALQLNLKDIPDIGKYFSEDTDILIIPNKYEGVSSIYDFEKMQNLSEHIAYLIKWMIPEEITIYVSLPSNPKNTNKDITKLLYNDGRLFKAVSDIGFGEINKDISQYFDNLDFSRFYIEEFQTLALFITPTLDDMLAEKIFYYAKYYKFKDMIKRKEPIMEQKYSNLTIQECEYILFKFKKAILKLIEAILKRDYKDSTDLTSTDSSKIILRGFLSNFEDYSNTEKEEIVISIYSLK